MDGPYGLVFMSAWIKELDLYIKEWYSHVYNTACKNQCQTYQDVVKEQRPNS